MDRRTQRVFLLCLFFGVAYLLYKSSSAHQDPQRRRKGPADPTNNAAAQLDLKGLVPANSTLGVSRD